MRFTVMCQNIQYGGRDDRWPRLAEVIRGRRPSVVLFQECNGWLDGDMSAVAQAERDLGMRVFVAPSQTGFHVAAAFDPGLFTWDGWETKYAHLLTHGYGALRLRNPHLPAPLVAISAHLTPYSAATAAQEAQILIARAYRHGGLGLIGGDINHCPLGDADPDWSKVQPFNRSSRTRLAPGGSVVGDTAVAERLAQGGLVDACARISDKRHDPALRGPTGKHGGVRVDQIHLTPALAAGLVAYDRIDPEGASDHYGVLATLDTSLFDATLLRTYT